MTLPRGGGKRDRTADLLHAMQALSQLSYTPAKAPDYTGRISLCKEWEKLLNDAKEKRPFVSKRALNMLRGKPLAADLASDSLHQAVN